MATEKISPGISTFRPQVFLIGAACFCLVIASLVAIRHFVLHPATLSQGWFNPFDAEITTYVNQLGNRYPWLNSVESIFLYHNILRNGPIVFLLWLAFFPRTGSAAEILEKRRKIAAAVSLALFGIVLARVLALVLPFRERPLRTAALHFQLPHIIRSSLLYGWSSFPSDNAVLLVALATGLLFVSRPLGTIALVYTFAVDLFLRVYMGFHWPTDLLAGAAIGVALASIVSIKTYRDSVWRLVMRCWQCSPGLSAVFVLFLSYEIVDMFDGPLVLAKALLKHHLQ